MIANHTRVKQFNVLLSVLDDYSITQKLGAIISNNASTNDILYRTIEKHIAKEFKIK